MTCIEIYIVKFTMICREACVADKKHPAQSNESGFWMVKTML